MPGYEDHITFGNRPNGIYVPRFRNVKDRHPDFVRGYGFQGGGWRERVARSLAFGAGYKRSADRGEAALEAGPRRLGRVPPAA